MPVWYDSPESTMVTIPTMEKGATAFLITGDASRNKIQTMPGGGFSTATIELPAAWDKLMGDLGYQPLGNYQLEATPTTAISSAKRTPSSYRNGRSNMYDMKGQRLVRKPQRGVYIQEGRKKLSR